VVPYIGFNFAYCIPCFGGPMSLTLKCLIYIYVGPQTACAVLCLLDLIVCGIWISKDLLEKAWEVF
jgi:hypothetical protein